MPYAEIILWTAFKKYVFLYLFLGTVIIQQFNEKRCQDTVFHDML